MAEMSSIDPDQIPDVDRLLAEQRDQIATEIGARFGNTAPYRLVQDFVRRGTPHPDDLNFRNSAKGGR